MIALVDTSIWSLALRRSRGPISREALELAELVREGRAAVIAPIRQEVLSGVKTPLQYARLRDHLRAFPDLDLATEDYELAADFFNRCRAKGIQGSNTDFLICAAASRHRQSVFTMDADFVGFAKILPVELHAPRK